MERPSTPGSIPGMCIVLFVLQLCCSHVLCACVSAIAVAAAAVVVLRRNYTLLVQQLLRRTVLVAHEQQSARCAGSYMMHTSYAGTFSPPLIRQRVSARRAKTGTQYQQSRHNKNPMHLQKYDAHPGYRSRRGGSLHRALNATASPAASTCRCVHSSHTGVCQHRVGSRPEHPRNVRGCASYAG